MVKLGLNSSQAKIYLTLVSLETANVKKIAQNAKIDRGEVYRQLWILQNKSLVEKILTIPNEYRPMPLKKTFEIMFQQKKIENEVLQKKS